MDHSAQMTSFVSHTSVDCRNAYELSEWWKQVLTYVDVDGDPNLPGHEECMTLDPEVLLKTTGAGSRATEPPSQPASNGPHPCRRGHQRISGCLAHPRGRGRRAPRPDLHPEGLAGESLRTSCGVCANSDIYTSTLGRTSQSTQPEGESRQRRVTDAQSVTSCDPTERRSRNSLTRSGACLYCGAICCIISRPLASPHRSTIRPSAIRTMSMPVSVTFW